MKIREDFLHYAWKHQLFTSRTFITTNGKEIDVIYPGIINTDAGPDFSQVKIKIDDIIWVGNIEIHIKSSDWLKHKHHINNAYNNIILHVVYENDIDITKKDPRVENTLVLKDIIKPSLVKNYKKLIKTEKWIPCYDHITKVDSFTIQNQLDRLAVERLQRKSKEIYDVLKHYNNDWNQTFFIFLFKAFGFKVNAIAFEMLGKSIPFQILEKNKHDAFVIEAILMGQAGFLEKSLDDEYYQHLQKEYQYQAKKHHLKPLSSSIFKFLRIRPDNFPTIRISQLAQLIIKFDRLHIWDVIKKTDSLKEFYTNFSIATSNYWETHYVFEKETPKHKKALGKESIEKIIINLLIPFKFAYADFYNEEDLKEKALNLLSGLSPEKNQIIKNWKVLNIKAKNAMDGQALLELKNEWCIPKKCCNCSIGHKILQYEK